jgi:hypothetical protein
LTEVTDESGAVVGRARYDALGGVLTRTIPVTLTSRLPGGAHLDADAGLVYDGAGRFYDAALGLYLQPDPFGAAPEAPESLNRYAATGVSTFPTVGSVPGGGASAGEVTFSLITNLSKLLVDETKVSPQFKLWGSGFRSWLHGLSRIERWVLEKYPVEIAKSARLAGAIDAGYGLLKRLRFGRHWAQNMAVGTTKGVGYAGLGMLRGLNTETVWKTRWVREVAANEAWWGRAGGRVAQSGALRWTGRQLGGLLSGAVVDVGFQFAWDLAFERDLTWRERGLRVAAELPGTAASWVAGGVSGWAVGALAGSAVGGPVGFAIGLAVAMIYDRYYKPGVYESLGLD